MAWIIFAFISSESEKSDLFENMYRNIDMHRRLRQKILETVFIYPAVRQKDRQKQRKDQSQNMGNTFLL